MPAFVYQARDVLGRRVQGRVEAESERDLIQRLRSQGLLVLGVARSYDWHTFKQFAERVLGSRVSGEELALFARQFATMVHSGLTVISVLRVLIRQSSHPTLRRALSQVALDVESGEPLAHALARQGSTFPVVMVQMVAAGEVGGFLSQVLDRLAEQFEKEEQLRQKVRSALIYPVVVSFVSIFVVIAMLIFVVPQFTQIYADLDAPLPFATKALLQLSQAIQHYGWFGLIAASALIIGCRQAVRTTRAGKLWDHLLLRLPVIGPIVAKHSIARFSRTLSGLLASGVTILMALAVVERTVGNRVVAAAVRQALESVRTGERLVLPLRQAAIFPPMVLEMVGVGEETGRLEEMLARIADYYDEEVGRIAGRLSSVIEPVLILAIGLTVGFIVLAIMLPVFNLWSII